MIHLIRHPPVAVAPGVCYGRSDVPLAAPVGPLAEALRARLPARFTLVSSPLARCRQLAEALGRPALDARFAEMDFGAWELRSFDAIGRAAIDAWAADPLHFRPPGGESVAAMRERALAALAGWLAEAPGPLVIVSHGGPLRALVGHLLALPDDAWPRHPFATGELQSLPRPPA
ncbi:MAG: alpha-ribazole phosphatase family protein [Candidatus Dactylopiibacterium sp.]|nr:alpha-ribazole phosphatase family protein [Candidatus Dactylopiibacterium sp.]